MALLGAPSPDDAWATFKVRDALAAYLDENTSIDGGEANDIAEEMLSKGYIDIPAFIAEIGLEASD